MGLLVDTLGNKAPGQLIKSADWNALVVAVETVEESLSQRIDDLSTSVDERFEQVGERVDQIETTLTERLGEFDERLTVLQSMINAVRTRVEPLLIEHIRVTMEAPKVNFAIGELADITARATDYEGNPLDLRDAATRPWVDFVTAWGQLKPAPGFLSRGGAGNKTISVQVNAEGIAMVQLKAEHTEGFTDDVELEVASSLTTTLQASNFSIADTILQAATPLEAQERGAFRAMSIEYDRVDASSVRSYTDTFYSQNSALITGSLIPRPSHRWRDYRSTVLAFLKSDADPRTPDQSRGISSIQVTFRDWISPWITLEYLPNINDRVLTLRDRLGTRITGNYRESVDLITADVKEIVAGRGLLGKQREYVALRGALDAINVSTPPEFLPTLSRAVQNAISVQQTQDYIQAATIGGSDDETTFEVLTEAIVRADTASKQFTTDFSGVTSSIAAFDDNINSLQAAVSAIDGRLEATLAEGGEFQRVRADVETVSQQVGILQNLDVGEVQSRMFEMQGMGNRLQALELIMSAR